MTVPVAERGSARQRGGGIARAAVLIGAITMLARVIGFGRQVVFAHTVQASCLGTAYTTANMVPNIIYDIVLGGALTAVVVPVLAGPAWPAAGHRAAGTRRPTASRCGRPLPRCSAGPCCCSSQSAWWSRSSRGR